MPTAEELIAKFSDQATLPHVAIRVNQLAQSDAATMHDFEAVIKLDPVLVTRLLRLVNSPYYGLVNKVESISKAVVFVGMKNLRNLVAIEGMKSLFKEEEDARFSRKNLWLHSATVAILAEMIATRIFSREGEDVFLAGIIHDIGMIVEDQAAGAQLRQACDLFVTSDRSLVACEQEVIGADHCEVGALLAREWHLPAEVLKAVKNHHNLESKTPVSSITSIIQLAEYMAVKMKYGAITGAVATLSPDLARHVKNMIANYKIIVRDLPAEMAKAKELYEIEES